MSFAETVVLTCVRSVLIVFLSLPISLGLSAFLRSVATRRWLPWALLVVPLIAPRMLCGYGYANFSLSLVAYPFWNEVLYVVLLIVSIVPLGTVLCYFAPPPRISAEAMHCLRLRERSKQSSKHRSPSRHLSWNHWSRYVVAMGLMFLLAFQEFELASLMGVHAWSVWLFDAQAGGLLLSASLQHTLIPLLIEAFVCLAVASAVWRHQRVLGSTDKLSVELSTAQRAAAWTYLAMAIAVFCLVPWTYACQAAASGIPQLLQNQSMQTEIVVGCLFSFLATVLAYVLASALVTKFHSDRPSVSRWRWRWLPAALVALPGLLGSLSLGLGILFVFQNSPLHRIYGSPIPWLTGLVLFLTPRACLIALLLTVVRNRPSEHLVHLMRQSSNPFHRTQGRELHWRGHSSLHYGALGILFFWAYGDLTLASLLGPPGLVPAPVRLYNLMHYGQSAVLSAMVVAAFGTPIVAWSLLGAFRRPLQRVFQP